MIDSFTNALRQISEWCLAAKYLKSLLVGLLAIGLLAWIVICLLRGSSRRSESNHDVTKESWEEALNGWANANLTVGNEASGHVYTGEYGNLKLLADSEGRKLHGIWVFLLAASGSLGLIFGGLSKFLPEQKGIEEFGGCMLLIFFASFAYLMIENGRCTLQMRFEGHREEDTRWLQGEVILTEKRIVGVKRKKERKTIVVRYSQDGKVWHIHRDTHRYALKRCPALGETVEILYSPSLDKALTRAEIKDAKRKVLYGILILVFLYLHVALKLFRMLF